MLSVVTFKWKPPAGYRSTFTARHVNVLRAMVERHCLLPHELVCVTDDAEGIDPRVRVVPLWPDLADLPSPHGGLNPSCYRRLKLFSAEAAALVGPRFVCLDLDTVIVDDVTPLWDRPEDFVIWGDTAKGTPYNGSMYLMTAGARRQVWDRFDRDASPALGRAKGYIGSDQAWIAACLGEGEATWTARDGVFSFRNEIDLKRPSPRDRKAPPRGARIVMFHGRIDPWSAAARARAPWVVNHWKE